MSIQLDEFEAIYGGSDNIGALRNKIIGLGVFGKLTSDMDRNQDGNKLLKQITKTRKKLIKDGKIKKPYGGIKPIKKSEIENLIPKNWSQARLKEIGDCQTGTTPSTKESKYYGGNIPFIKPGDIINRKVDYNNNSLTQLGLEKGRKVEKNSILMVCIGGSMGKTCYVDRVCSCNQQINYIKPFNGVDYKFLYYVMQSEYFQKKVHERATGSATPIINKTKWSSIIVPIPPLKEQKMIANKIETLINKADILENIIVKKEETSENLSHAVVDAINKSENGIDLKENLQVVIDNMDKIFNTPDSMEEMRNIVLQLAIEGKLVDQDPSDEPVVNLIQEIYQNNNISFNKPKL